MTDKLRVDLSGAPQTMLATLYAKALDAGLDKPILGDRWAKDIVDRIDYDWAETTITRANSPSVTSRSAHFDRWVRQFLAVHPEAVVLHLGCGLDTRFFRVAPRPGVQWYDVDYPDVAELRRQLVPADERCHLVAASVTDPGWLADIPADRPMLMVAEGLTMYLTEAEGIALLNRVVDRFPSGELQFDAFSRLAIRTQWTNRVVRRSGSRLHWGIDAPEEILRAVPRVRLLARQSPFDSASLEGVPWYYRLLAAAISVVPSWRYLAQYHRYAF